MPWCEPCERFFNPNTLHVDGTCPTCGEQLGDPRKTGWRVVPWHFWVLLLAMAIYLGWRAVQGVVWVVERF